MNEDPGPRHVTSVYDACGRLISTSYGEGAHVSYEYTSPAFAEAAKLRAEEPAAAQEPGVPQKAILTHTFEFRLSGSETAEQVLPLSGSRCWTAGRVVAMQRVRAYVTRQGEAEMGTSAIGGVEVHAELRDGGIYATAQLCDFDAGDLVVVQVEVALY